MRIYSYTTLRKFWGKYPDARGQLEAWYEEMENSNFSGPNDIIANYPMADIVKNGRVVFNICHNKYRIVALFRYRFHTVYVRFIGTHREYDKIKDIENI